MTRQLITDEAFTSIQEAQAGLARLFEKAARRGGFYRVLRNNRSLGVLIPDRIWESLIEDFEALSSPGYLKTIEKARKSRRRYTSKEVKKKLGF